MRFRPLLLVVGVVLLGLSGVMLLPAAVAWYFGEPAVAAFFQAAAIVAAAAVALVVSSVGSRVLIYPKQTFIITTTVWMSVSLFGALPFIFYSDIGYADAVFETMSGITTTGATALVGLDTMPRSVLLWRSLLQWGGGLGFAVMAVAILPFLGVGGMRLFRSESSDWSDKAMPRMQSLALYITLIYLGLSVVCGLAYFAAGMSPFDAINHAMTTVATGGYSTYDASLGHFASAPIDWIAVAFMILGALPFALYVKAFQDRGRALVTDQQVRGFLLLILSSTLVLAAWLYLRTDMSLASAFRVVAVNLTSIVTTTGYSSADYSEWGGFAVMMFFYLTFVGGCSGSTAGGFKIFRLQIAIRVLSNQIRRQVHPHGVFVLEYNHRALGDDVVRSIIGFSFVFFATIAALAFALSFFDLDFLTSISSAATAVTNVGPGLGPIVGPGGNFASLPDGAKWLLTAGMLLGRLEIMTVIVLFTRRFWVS